MQRAHRPTSPAEAVALAMEIVEIAKVRVQRSQDVRARARQTVMRSRKLAQQAREYAEKIGKCTKPHLQPAVRA